MKLINGEGNLKSKIVFVGEAPGEQEEICGKPFVGRSGSILLETLMSYGVFRDQVYLTNVVKFRPPENRTPTDSEVQQFLPLLRAELALIKPEVVVTLGRVATEALLGQNIKITTERGVARPTLEGYFVVPTYHPSFLGRVANSYENFQLDIKNAIKRAYGQR
jgi:DNA polymerase